MYPHYVVGNFGGMTRISIKCIVCKEDHTIDIPQDAYTKWRWGGVFIKDAFPGISEEDKELLINGICPKCDLEKL